MLLGELEYLKTEIFFIDRDIDPFPETPSLLSYTFVLQVVYYESITREIQTEPIYECLCDERPKHKAEESTRLVMTGVYDKTN